jgi:hypothetical protein
MSLVSMVKRIEAYNKDEQLCILDLIVQDNDALYNENHNGTFVKMETLSPYTIQKIEDYIQYIEKKEKDIHEGEIKMNEIKKDLNI